MNKKNIKQHFNNNYKYLAKRYDGYDAKEIHANWISNVNFQGLKILELGSGSGRDALFYAENGAEVIAIDSSSKMIEFAKDKDHLNSVSWIVDELPDLISLKSNNQFDLITATAVLMFLSPADQILSLKRFRELLNCGGRVIITFKEDIEDIHAYLLSPNFMEAAKSLGFKITLKNGGKDKNGRVGVSWKLFIFSLV